MAAMLLSGPNEGLQIIANIAFLTSISGVSYIGIIISPKYQTEELCNAYAVPNYM